jgi:hypothetical protein
MSTFADFLIEFGSRRSAAGTPKLPFRGSPWCEASGDFGPSRMLLSTPRVAGLTATSAGPWTAWTVGEVGSYRDTNGSTAKCVDRFLNDLQNGSAKPETLGGRFLILGWSAQARRWNIWTDRMGSVQAYFVEGLDGAALGTYSPAIYSYSRRDLDWVGLSSFFSLGFFIGDRTHYEDCKILRPASRYEYDATGNW